ncbi:MAG: FIG00815270: hypothetical protein [uncultured Nocardioides sp.]|uniref:Uncharacterized protein n=1 Tax=uncultured Nocardioides sp. TaxID=198441 RepID=A0A6J4N860_9ACTN|nr:MAG: FIG00815270: hypothetical protein [uncultured Nocardioides sp.]
MGIRSRWCTLVMGALVAVLAAVPVTQAGAVGHPHPTLVSADPADNTPHVLNGTVRAIAAVGSRVYVGGTFTTVVNAGTSAQLPRSYLFAFDRGTGRVVPGFVPAVDGVVESIAAAPDGSSVIVAGRFKTVNGTTQRSLAMIDANGARVAAFGARTNGYVNKVLVRGSRVVVGGRFSTVNGSARANLAVLNATTGALDTRFAIGVAQGRTKASGTVTKPAVQEMDADAAGNRLMVIGNFRTVGGLSRQQIAMIDLPSATVMPWSTTRYPNDVSGTHGWQCGSVFDTQMRDVDFSPDGSYFVVVTTGGAPDRNVTSLCDTAARWESNGPPDAVESWKNCTGGDTLYSVATTGVAIYVGGHQRWLDNCGGKDTATPGSFSAPGIGALDPATGRAIRTWNPGRTRGVGAEELVAAADGLYVGSDTTSLGGEYHARLGRFPMS